ncbi:hypothetical protein [Paenibacillus beijingensis]|uniref:Uncharacterized protein n=1 Tax=Paenibacillus beijingensis TaxID=1126833 RepID=A0A0D5NGN7_9BACL|nr:hypothetical protein [Paenibacillus beijingensis]AJY74285.1 hypothetical protein VN24_06445 [Paenibacillus beijingensis]
MLFDSLMEYVREETYGTMKLNLDNMIKLAEYNPFIIQSKKDPSHVMFQFHPDSYTAPILKEGNILHIDFTRLRPIEKQDIEQLFTMYNNRIYTLYAFAFMFDYEEKGLILLRAQQLPTPPTFNRKQTNELLEEALKLEAEGSYFAFSSIFHPSQLIDIVYDNQKISTAVGGHSTVTIIPVEKKWRIQLRKNKKEPEDDFGILRRLLKVCKEEAEYLESYFHKNGLQIKS